MAADVRHFACTACGACCDRGPEMELAETIGLADQFILSLLFKVENLPLDERSERAKAWWQRQDSRIPPRPALEEARRGLAPFTSRKRAERARDRQWHLLISAIVADDGRGRCPALADRLCTIHDRRPLTCRTVPLHYSRPPSTLRAYLDRFTATPGHQCETGPEAPAILDGGKVIDPRIAADREAAVTGAKAERVWKEHLLAVMDDPIAAGAAGLPAIDAVLAQSDNGFASLVPIIAAWRIALRHGLLSAESFKALCAAQAALIRRAIVDGTEGGWLRDLTAALPLYEGG